jgi:hypothetical protein
VGEGCDDGVPAQNSFRSEESVGNFVMDSRKKSKFET